MHLVERDALVLNVDLEALFVAVGEVNVVADLALDRNIGNETLHGFGVDAGQVAGVRIAVGVAIGDIEEENGVVALGGVGVDGGGGHGGAHGLTFPFHAGA